MESRDSSTECLEFVDAHHHFWNLSTNRYAWLEGKGDPSTVDWIGEYSSIRQNYLPNQYLQEGMPNGLVKSVHVQAGWTGSDTVNETKWLQNLYDLYGFPNGIVAEVDLRSEKVEKELEKHQQYSNLRGIRMVQMLDFVNDHNFLRGFSLLKYMNLSYDLNTGVGCFEGAVALAKKFPGTLIIVGNTANPRKRTEEYFEAWRYGMAQLGKYHNVVVKISGLGMLDHTWTNDSIRRWILTAIDIFSPERCMLASNWPVDRLYSSFSKLISTYRDLTASFSEEERINMFKRNAEKYYRI